MVDFSVSKHLQWYFFCFCFSNLIFLSLEAYFSYLQKQPPEVFCKKKVFLEISQISQENTCARVSFLIKAQVFSCEFGEISKKHLFHRTPPDDCFCIFEFLRMLFSVYQTFCKCLFFFSDYSYYINNKLSSWNDSFS